MNLAVFLLSASLLSHGAEASTTADAGFHVDSLMAEVGIRSASPRLAGDSTSLNSLEDLMPHGAPEVSPAPGEEDIDCPTIWARNEMIVDPGGQWKPNAYAHPADPMPGSRLPPELQTDCSTRFDLLKPLESHDD